MIWRNTQSLLTNFLNWFDRQWAQGTAIQQRIDEQREKARAQMGPRFWL